jgi:hypothetical protein
MSKSKSTKRHVTLRVCNGEYGHTLHILIEGGGLRYATTVARNYYDHLNRRDGNVFYFNLDEVSVQVQTCEPITEEEFETLAKFLPVM